MSPTSRHRKFWGWGYEDAGPNERQAASLLATLSGRLGGADLSPTAPPRIEDLELPASRIAPPDTLAEICSATPLERASHTYGKSYRDVVRGLRGDFSSPPDLVARPRDEAEVTAVLDWCSGANVAALPFGGGSSVVGGVEAAVGSGYAGVVSLDLSRLDRVLEIDETSRAGRFQAGLFGPALEDALRPRGLTLRHFPQSFEFSTLGGWIATRSGGHYATLHTHIDDFVEALRVVTPTGVVETRRLPASGAGPSPDRLWIGSEGILGVITEAWMRLQERPRFRASASVRFPSANGGGDEAFLRGAAAARALAQSGLFPTNCRLLDPAEALTSGAGGGDAAILVLGFESADHDPAARTRRALELCRDAGGEVPEGAGETRTEQRTPQDGAAGAWRSAFLGAPYVRDVLARASVVSETFETAVTWDRFEAFHRGVKSATEDAARRVCGGSLVACRLTHVYPDGAAPYYTVLAPGRRGDELEQWAEIKSAASDALLALGGTITHHHAVGRDHRNAYDRQRPDVFARALVAAKRELDPAGILNPGVLVDPAAR